MLATILDGHSSLVVVCLTILLVVVAVVVGLVIKAIIAKA